MSNKKKHSCKFCKRKFYTQGEYIIVPGVGKFCDDICWKKSDNFNSNKE